jgi:hypothetical protein
MIFRRRIFVFISSRLARSFRACPLDGHAYAGSSLKRGVVAARAACLVPLVADRSPPVERTN